MGRKSKAGALKHQRDWHSIDYDELEQGYSDSDEEVLMNMDNVSGIGITLQ